MNGLYCTSPYKRADDSGTLKELRMPDDWVVKNLAWTRSRPLPLRASGRSTAVPLSLASSAKKIQIATCMALTHSLESANLLLRTLQSTCFVIHTHTHPILACCINSVVVSGTRALKMPALPGCSSDHVPAVLQACKAIAI